MMDESELQEYVDRSRNLIDDSPQVDEATTKVRLVQPLVNLLGWDMYSEVELEYPVRMGTGTKKVDYALMVEGVPEVFVEAKGRDTTLTERHLDQLRSYMRIVGVDWGVLTNGQTFQVLKRRTDADKPEEVVLGAFDLEELDGKAHLLEALSREAIASGEASDIAEQIERRQRTVETLRANKEEVAERIAEAVVDELGASLSFQIEDEAKAFVDNLVVTLEGRRRTRNDDETEPEEEGAGPGEIQAETADGFTPAPDANAVVGTCKRSKIDGDDDTEVAVFPAKPSGEPFLQENNAWAFARIGRTPEYLAIYISDDVRAVKYVAEVAAIVSPEEADLAHPLSFYSEAASDTEQAGFDPDKKVVVFEPGTLYELADPIPYENEYPRSLRYTTLGEFRRAETTDDIF